MSLTAHYIAQANRLIVTDSSVGRVFATTLFAEDSLSETVDYACDILRAHGFRPRKASHSTAGFTLDLS